MKYRMVITPPHEGPQRLAPHGIAQFWVEGWTRGLFRHMKWRRLTPKKDLALKQPMPHGGVWELGEHATMPKGLVALRDEDLPA